MHIAIFDRLKDYTLKDYYPLFIIVTGYMLFRPYLMKLGGELQKREHRKASQESAIAAAKAAVEPPKSDEQFITETESRSWGRNARRRQKERIKEIEKSFARKKEMETEYESDKEIEEFLTE
ncbi:protein trafficking Pga2 [Lipomyces oligophaga]|uniref:protein trafficking Pga2 n=1 Tax=Lipomyces oligophaga TaxID=45792 RepID=UPI0034CF9216